MTLDDVSVGQGHVDAHNQERHKINTLETNLGSISKTSLGLGNVDNVSDANKPVSAAQQTALDAKQNLIGALVGSPPFSVGGAASVKAYALRWYCPHNCTITSVRVSAGTAPTGAALIVDVLKNGVSIFPTSPKPQIAAGAFTGSAVPDTTVLAAGDYLTVSVTQIGSTVAGSDVSIQPVLTLA